MTNNKKLALTGGYAAALALKHINPDVMAVYPITPQTPIIEIYSKFKADGEVDTEIIHVESEHSAMSACVGSSAAGARTVTATSSQGLSLMNEVVYIAAGLRLPILMAVSARALAAPINIHGDHSDVMGCRDSGWVQIFCENPQEVYDKTIIGMKLAEAVKFPVMVIMDGFNTSHSVENMEDLDDKIVKDFVGEYKPEKYLLDLENPVTFGPVALQNSYFEFRKDMADDFENIQKEYEKICADYEKISGRKYGIFEEYKIKNAEKVIVAMGSVCGTIKDAIDKMEKEGEKVGLMQLNLFRPFPYKDVKKALYKAKEVIVMDRNLTFGTKQALASEISHAIGKEVKSFVYGLGGRDTFQKQIIDMVQGQLKDNYLL
ncbi:MAG TPA: transketolase C-terminal domain-containing protein [Candidatus Moranbacteria bacterium]|nr:transketolase C-terminal domain-containing protein [Candidatus Moranbacteria bacterium]